MILPERQIYIKWPITYLVFGSKEYVNPHPFNTEMAIVHSVIDEYPIHQNAEKTMDQETHKTIL